MTDPGRSKDAPDPAYRTGPVPDPYAPVDYPEAPVWYPPPVYPPMPYPPPAPVIPGTNGKAIASLVCGAASLTLCMCYLPGIAAIVLGLLALPEISRNRQGGQGLAIGGMVLGGLSLVIAVVLMFSIGSRPVQ